jgi:hypothetical protein
VTPGSHLFQFNSKDYEFPVLPRTGRARTCRVATPPSPSLARSLSRRSAPLPPACSSLFPHWRHRCLSPHHLVSSRSPPAPYIWSQGSVFMRWRCAAGQQTVGAACADDDAGGRGGTRSVCTATCCWARSPEHRAVDLASSRRPTIHTQQDPEEATNFLPLVPARSGCRSREKNMLAARTPSPRPPPRRRPDAQPGRRTDGKKDATCGEETLLSTICSIESILPAAFISFNLLSLESR